MANACRSVRDPRELGRRLENELMDALALNTRCGGVTVIREPQFDWERDYWLSVYQDHAKIKKQGPYWDLMLDYTPGIDIYGWTLFPEKADGHSAGPMVNGEGTTPQVADQICTVVTRRGATIR